MKKLHRNLDSITRYLKPLLPFANCHMVDYFVSNHWDKLMPTELKKEFNEYDFNVSLERFWNEGLADVADSKSQFSEFIKTARSHCLKVDNDICLSLEQMKARVVAMNGQIKEQIFIKEFMTAKKSYEVQIMSPLVASLFEATCSSHCVDLGGGAGHLGVVLDLGYNVPSLAVDCDVITMAGGKKRDPLIKKQWQSIARGANNTSKTSGNLHHYAHTFVKNDTNLCQIINEKFGQSDEEIRVLLTGLHTCGNLGSDSLRLFISMKSMAAVFNVPCCYHLLTEEVDDDMMWNAFDKTCSVAGIVDGFPMSQYMRGYQLGRNARMLAAQSIDRVLSRKELPTKSLLYRAVLQQIIKDKIANRKITEGKLRRISKKSANFLDYFRGADAILNLQLHTLTDNYLTDVFDRCQLKWKNMVLFYLVRLCLSQVVECLILLDRLLFLYENGCGNAFLVKLFDPAVSPRCHGIVAFS